MKPLVSKLSAVNAVVFYPFTLLWKRPWVVVFSIVVLVVTGCFRKFYHASTTNIISASQLDSLKSADKYFIVHFQNKLTYNLSNISIQGDTISGQLIHLPYSHSLALKVNENSTRVMPGKHASGIVREVHLYTNLNPGPDARSVSIPRNSMYRMDIYKFDKDRTTVSTVVSIIGIVVFVAMVVLLISAGSSTPDPAPTTGEGCNCPKIHIEKDGQFEYVNGVFSGAVYSNLERSDILPLENLNPDSNIRIRISNTPGEKQFINTVSLMAVKHRSSEKVLADRKGNFIVLDKLERPLSGTDQNGKDVSELLDSADDQSFSFDRDLEQEGASSVILEFDRSTKSDKISLMIRAKNTEWAASLTKTYMSLFGNKFQQWREHIEKTDPSTMEKRELQQNLPISVYVLNGEKWEFVDYFPLTGSTAYRDLVMSIPLPARNDNGKLRIKLETVFNLWQLNMAVIDPQPAPAHEPITLTLPLDKNGKDLPNQLNKVDRHYLIIGEDQSIDLNFKNMVLNGNKESVSYFLKASGYYHYEEQFMGEPDMSRLREFKSPGAFSRFSKQQYREYQYWVKAVSK